MAAQIAGNPVTCSTPNSCADFLNGRHKRERNQHRPSDPEPELRAGLAICPDAGRVIVGCTGDEAWAKGPEEPSENSFSASATLAL